jgi:antitoxin (DNA-binding transcriptional repressor) of toxin-antitoxin stability system
MSTHSVAEARNRLSKLIDRALKGEEVVITRRGQPVVEFKPVRSAPPMQARQVTEADIEWLRARRALLPRSKVDAGTFVSQMRDEEWER